LRQALFADFAHHALRAVASIPHAPLILLTGGLATPAQLRAALSSQHAHLLGLGRSAVLRPDLPQLLKQHPDTHVSFAPAPDLHVGDSASWILKRLPRIRLVGAGAAMAWYIVALRRLTTPEPARTPDYAVGALGGVWWMWVWVGPEAPLVLRFIASIVAAAAAVLAWWALRTDGDRQ
jgi:hypothetical protein